MNDVSCFGELLIDFTSCGLSKSGNVLFERNPGGAPANVCVSLAKLGKKSVFIGMVGDDIFGEYLKNYLHSMKVDTAGLKKSLEAKTTLAFVELDKNGERSFGFYRNPGADTAITKKDIDPEIITNSKVFHFGSLSMTHEQSRKALFYSLKMAKKNGLLISYDPNYRPMLWNSREDAKRRMISGLKYADILKISEEELEVLTSTVDPVKGSLALYDMGITIVLITLGKRGAFYRYKGGSGFIKGFKVKTIDTTGAGDSFLGGILYNLCGKTKEAISALQKNDVVKIVEFANAAGAITTTRRGAMPAMPSLNEVKKMLKFKKFLNIK